MNSIIDQAIQLRKNGKGEEALTILSELLKTNPKDPIANFQMAWTCDYLGKESAAAPYYEVAIANGLYGEDLRGAMLGLGSTYRCLGDYQNSIRVLDQAVQKFPEDRSLKIFRALTLFNLGKPEDTVQILLTQLLETTNDEVLASYKGALGFYSDKLHQTWKD